MQKDYVTKSSGEIAEFSEQKLRTSLTRSGANKELTNEIIAEIEKGLYPGISTEKIYRKAFMILKARKARPATNKYKLKQAIMELGPSGFPFEKYIGEILKTKGYSVQVGQVVQGHCVSHEVDVVAEKSNEIIMIECKFHNNSGHNSDVKTSLYIHSRFRDIEKQLKKSPEYQDKIFKGWIVTNTKFTEDATKFGVCSGLNLLSWDFPEKDNLRELIEGSVLYPITTLSTITEAEKQKLLNMKMVLCSDVPKNKDVLSSLGINQQRVRDILDECNKLCNC